MLPRIEPLRRCSKVRTQQRFSQKMCLAFGVAGHPLQRVISSKPTRALTWDLTGQTVQHGTLCLHGSVTFWGAGAWASQATIEGHSAPRCQRAQLEFATLPLHQLRGAAAASFVGFNMGHADGSLLIWHHLQLGFFVLSRASLLTRQHNERPTVLRNFPGRIAHKSSQPR